MKEKKRMRKKEDACLGAGVPGALSAAQARQAELVEGRMGGRKERMEAQRKEERNTKRKGGQKEGREGRTNEKKDGEKKN